jgi:hypothetical protein
MVGNAREDIGGPCGYRFYRPAREDGCRSEDTCYCCADWTGQGVSPWFQEESSFYMKIGKFECFGASVRDVRGREGGGSSYKFVVGNEEGAVQKWIINATCSTTTAKDLFQRLWYSIVDTTLWQGLQMKGYKSNAMCYNLDIMQQKGDCREEQKE